MDENGPALSPATKRRGRTRKLEWRLNEVRKMLSTTPLSDARIIERFSAKPAINAKGEDVGGWGVTPRTIERMIQTVREEATADLAAQRPDMAAQMELQIKALYGLCIQKGKLEAAGRCQDRLLRLYGLGAQRVELTGRDGKPVELHRKSYDLTDRTDEELALLERVLGSSTDPATTH